MCRHGTTTWNLAKKWQGQQDTELAPEGLRQAEEGVFELSWELCLAGKKGKKHIRTQGFIINFNQQDKSTDTPGKGSLKTV